MKVSDDTEKLLKQIRAIGEYQVLYEYPPNIEQIKAVLPDSMKRGVIFTYGGKVYNPSRVNMTEELVAHEAVHIVQQNEVGTDQWWDLYLREPNFRYSQEAEAHKIELLVIAANNNRHYTRFARKQIARRLAGPLYGNSATYAVAHDDIVD